MERVARYIDEQNRTVFEPKGIVIGDPMDRGLRCVSLMYRGHALQYRVPSCTTRHTVLIISLCHCPLHVNENHREHSVTFSTVTTVVLLVLIPSAMRSQLATAQSFSVGLRCHILCNTNSRIVYYLGLGIWCMYVGQHVEMY